MDTVIDWIFDFVSNHLFISFVLFFVMLFAIGYIQVLRKANFYQKARNIASASLQRLPATYKRDLDAELLVYFLWFGERWIDFASLQKHLAWLTPEEATTKQAVNRLASRGVLERRTNPEDTSSSQEQTSFKISRSGADLFLSHGITPLFSERAQRSYAKVSDSLYAGFDPSAREPSKTAWDICTAVLQCFNRIQEGFVEAYVKPLARLETLETPRSELRSAWLALKLIHYWSSEYTRARKFALDLCEATRRKLNTVEVAIANFDVMAARLEDRTWNETMLLLLNARTAHEHSAARPSDPSPMSFEDKRFLRDILADVPSFISPDRRHLMLRFMRPPGLNTDFDLSGSPMTAAEGVVQKLLAEPLRAGDLRLAMLKNLCVEISNTPELPELHKRQLEQVMMRYEYLRDNNAAGAP